MSITTSDEQKGELQILILGPYRPKSMLQRLESLRDCLIAKQFKKARLVKDFDTVRYDSDYDIHFTRKSRWRIKNWSHIPIFVFFKNADNLGVGNELAYTCLKLPAKTSNSAVFLERSLDVGSQVRGTIKLGAKNQKLSYECFEDDNDLCKLAFGHCIKKRDHLFYYLG